MEKEKTEEKHKEEGFASSITPIIMKNVSFKYATSEQMILNHINMKIQKGDKIAIVGENGAGKSTLIKLILGQYKPSSGEILWNGQKEMNGEVAVVFQDFIKFELTLRENIALGNIKDFNNDKKMIETLERCDLMGLYEELGGLDVVLGQVIDGGRQLSGGQWQKLAIARALFNNADFLVFDEMTAAIDPISEVEIYNKLIEICQDKTAIFISHRLGWTKNVDCIYVMENGRIVEFGKHHELMKKSTIYAHMYNQQASWYS